jgi:hypothetical protein
MELNQPASPGLMAGPDQGARHSTVKAMLQEQSSDPMDGLRQELLISPISFALAS